jgi:hypothetical protein
MTNSINTPYNFIVRAKTPFGIFDRAFVIDVQESLQTTWSTSSGYSDILDYNTSTAYLHIGPENEKYAITNQWVNYQFNAYSSNENYSKITYYIPENGGKLPPGLSLSQDGMLSGFLRDNLIFDGSQSDTGGYDEEAYDAYNYDHGQVLYDPIGVPKIYNFKINASNGISESSRYFKILVVSPDMIRAPERVQMSLEPGVLTTITNYLPPIQFINGTDLGEIRAANNETISVAGYDPYPTTGVVNYTIVPGNNIYTNLPNFLKLDPETGVIYGYIPYQPAYSTDYALTVNAVKTYSTYTSISTNTFTLKVKGEVESSIVWLSSATLAPITVGEVSELAVVAKQINSDYKIKYSLTSGTLPEGLSFNFDGTISGTPGYLTTGTYSFAVKAQDVYELSAITKSFTLSVVPYNNKKYTKIYARPFLNLDARKVFQSFILDSDIFPSKSLYRNNDVNFGLQSDFKVVFEFGIEETSLENYYTALRENFYRKKLYFGDYKVVIAQDANGVDLYEVVYVDIIDTLETAEGTSVSSVVFNNDAYYPNSITNMKLQLKRINIDNMTKISVNEYNLPRFMRTPQVGEYRQPGYMHVLPLCYTLPGEGQKILSRIKLSGFNFNQFDFEVDRLIVESTSNSNSNKYLLFNRQTISDQIPEDNLLFGSDGVLLESSTNNPITKT